MARRHYLVTYDISDDKRRTKVYKTLLGAGDHVQYSVFLCELNDSELAGLRSTVRTILNKKEDQLLFVDLGLASAPVLEGIEAIGRSYSPTARVLVV